jgi:uncharacterized 2Fe-2S/4Fe-4S cluster protein (DUF4445 family)
VAALLDGDARAAIELQVRRVEKIEIASEPGFQEHFVAAMALPHGVDRFPQLSKQVALPKPAAAGAATGPRVRSARRPRRA